MRVATREFDVHILQMIYLDIAVDVEPVVLASEHDASVLHERHVKALSVLHLALQSSQQLPSLDRTSVQP